MASSKRECCPNCVVALSPTLADSWLDALAAATQHRSTAVDTGAGARSCPTAAATTSSSCMPLPSRSASWTSAARTASHSSWGPAGRAGPPLLVPPAAAAAAAPPVLAASSSSCPLALAGAGAGTPATTAAGAAATSGGSSFSASSRAGEASPASSCRASSTASPSTAARSVGGSAGAMATWRISPEKRM